MTSEIRTNSLKSRAGLSTVTLTDSGPIFSGITTFLDNSTFSVGTGGTIHAPATNTLNIGVNNTESLRIDSNSNLKVAGIVTATSFKLSDGSAVGGVESDSSNNTVGGTNAGDSITSASNCTFFGKDAGTDITDGNANTFIGSNAGSNTNSGTYYNTFIGYQAGVNNGNGNQNVFIGANTGLNNSAWDNVFVGNYSGTSNTSGTQNVFIGKYSGTSNQSGSHNSCLGQESGNDITSGSSNTCIGHKAGNTGTNDLTEGSNNILIGHDAAASSATVSNEITLGDSNITKFRIPGLNYYNDAGKVGVKRSTPLANLHVANNELAIGDNPASAAAPNATYDGLVVDGSNASFINIRSRGNGSASYGRVAFSDDVRSRGYVEYRHEDGSNDDQLRFATASAVRLIIDSSGNIGVNETAPSEKLQIDGDILLGGQANSSESNYAIKFEYNNHQFAKIVGDGRDSTGYGDIDFYTSSGSGVSNLTQRMTIRANGYVGVNVTSPQRLLHLLGNDGTTGNTSGNSDTQLLIENAGGNGAIMEFMSANNSAGRIMFTDNTSNQGQIVYEHNGDILRFVTNGQDRYRIDGNGHTFFSGMSSLTASGSNKGINMENSSNYGRMNIHANSSAGNALGLSFYNNGNNVGTIYYSTSGTAYNTSSDYRLKENEVSISDGITRLKSLKPYRFNFKVDPDKTVDGFFAHEVAPVIPEAVTGEKDAEDMQQIDQAKLVPLLTAALQEAIAKIEKLEQDNIALRARVTNLEGN